MSGTAQTNLTSEQKSTNTIGHKVAMGETVMLIARKYRVMPQDICNLNPDAVNGISSNTMLSIPSGLKNDNKPKPESHRDITEVKNYLKINGASGQQ